MQLSNDESGEDDDGLSDDSKVTLVFLLNVIGCIVCCGAIQGIIVVSKRTNAELIFLRKNYKQYKSLMSLRDMHKNYNETKQVLTTI